MNPVLRKDVLALLRLRRVAAVQILFAVLLGVMVLGTWPQQGVMSLAARSHDALLMALIMGQLLLVLLFVPGAAAVSVTSEREQGTIEMLYASRLSPAQLITGKLLYAIGYPLLLLLTGLPFVALLCYRGDVDLNVLGWSYLILLIGAMLLAMLSLAISALCRQSATALVISYVAALLICGGVLVPAAIMLASQGGMGAEILHYMRSVSPAAAALSLLRPRLAEFGGRAGGIDPSTGEQITGLLPAWQTFIPAAGALILLSLFVLIWVLRRPPADMQPTRSASNAAHKRSWLRRILFLIDPDKQRKPLGRLNPMLGKESRTNHLRSSRWMIRIFYGALFVAMGLALMAMYGGQTEHGDLLRYVAAVIVTFQIAVIVLIAPSLTSPAISSEIESATFETLRLTPLRAGQIFWGKFLPAFLPALLPIAALLPAYGAICFVNPVYLRTFTLLLPVLVMSVAVCCAAGLVCSAFVENTPRASVTNYLVIATIVVLPMLIWLAGGQYLDLAVAARLAMPSPLMMGLSLLPDGSADLARLLPAHLIFHAVLCLIMLILARVRLGFLLQRG